MMQSEVEWKWHEKYKRNYRDFAENGKRWRQYDNDSGPRVEIRTTAQSSSGQQQTDRRNLTTPRSQPATLSTALQSSTSEAQPYDAGQYPTSNSPPNLSNQYLPPKSNPPPLGDPWGYRTASLNLGPESTKSSGFLPSTQQSSSTFFSSSNPSNQYSPPESNPLTSDTNPLRDPWGNRIASLDLNPESAESTSFSPSTQQSLSSFFSSSSPVEGLDAANYASGEQTRTQFQTPSRVPLQPSGYVSDAQFQMPSEPSSQVTLQRSGYLSGGQIQMSSELSSQLPFQSSEHISDILPTGPYPEATIPQSATRPQGRSVGTSRPQVRRNPSSDRPAKKYPDLKGNILTTASSRRRPSSASSRSDQDVESILGRMSLQQPASIDEQPFNELPLDESTSEPSEHFSPADHSPLTQHYHSIEQQPPVSQSSYDWKIASSNPKPKSDLIRPSTSRLGSVSRSSQRMVEEQLPEPRSSNLPYMERINEYEALLPKILGSAGAGEKEKLDHRYKRRQKPAEFFKEGRVFALLWSEPHGDNGTELSRGSFNGRFGQKVYSSIRRMVVVKERKGFSWCIPISTYGGQGTSKAGIEVASHAIIYMNNEQPARLAAETELTKDPIAVVPAGPDQKLDQLSRVNFAKMYTVEHNVKVMSVGTVAPKSMPTLKVYFKEEFDR